MAGKGVVFENSNVTWPSHSGSKGVTLTIIPHLAYVDFPRQIVNTDLGILKYSTVDAKAKEFGGIMHVSPSKSTKLFLSNSLGSTTAEFIFVNTLNILEHLTSYP